MQAELKGLDSSDVPAGLAAFRPADAQNFHLEVAARIGPRGEEGEDLFYFSVCTARWLADHPPPKGFELLRHHLLLERWSHELLVRAISDLCVRAEGNTWSEVASNLARYGRWEFED